MSDLDRIRKRIRSKEENPKQNRVFSFFYRFILLFMTVISLFITGLIMTNTPMDKVKDMGSVIIHSIKKADFILFENWFTPTSDMVNATKIYQKLTDNYYSNASNVVYSISDGIVIYMNEYEKDNYSIIIKNDNGILVTYGNLHEVQVQLEDRVLKDSILGTYYEKIYMDFLENNEYISYEDAVSKN